MDDTKGLTEEEVKEMQAEREAKANAQLLEMVCIFYSDQQTCSFLILFMCV